MKLELIQREVDVNTSEAKDEGIDTSSYYESEIDQ